MSSFSDPNYDTQLEDIEKIDFPAKQWENIPLILQQQFLQMNRQLRQITQYLNTLSLPDQLNEVDQKIGKLQSQHQFFTTITYQQNQSEIECRLKQIDSQLGSKIDTLQAETDNLQKASKLIHIQSNTESQHSQQNIKNFDLHFSGPVNRQDQSQVTQVDNAKAIWNMINTFIVESHIPNELKKIEEKIEEQKIEFEKKLSKQIQPKLIEHSEQIKSLDTNLIHKEKKLLFQIEQINQNDFQGMKQQIRESKEYLIKSQQFQTTQTQVNNSIQQKLQEVILDYNTKMQLIQKDTVDTQRRLDQIKTVNENMIKLFQNNVEENQSKQQKQIHECITRLSRLENIYSQEMGNINQQMELNQKSSQYSFKEEIDVLNKKIIKSQKESYQEIAKVENAINDIFPRFKAYQQKNKDFESQINSIIHLSQQDMNNKLRNLVKELTGGSDEKIKSLEEMIENLINLLHQNLQDKLNGSSPTNKKSVPMFLKENNLLNQEGSVMINNSLNNSQNLIDEQGKKSSSDKSPTEREEYSLLKSQRLDTNVKFLSELHSKPFILKSPIKFNSTLKKANDTLSRTEIQIMFQENHPKQPIHSKSKLGTKQLIRSRNNSLGISQVAASSQSPMKLKLSQNRVFNTDENHQQVDLSKSAYPNFNTVSSEQRRNIRSQTQDYKDLVNKPKQLSNTVLNSDHILCMELEAFKQQFTNQRRTKWSNSGSPNS